MTALRNYSSRAVRAALTAPVNESGTTISVSTTNGWAQPPLTILVDKDLSAEEVMTVTSVSGLNCNVIRGEDGTPAVAHLAGATVQHGVSGRDFQEAGDHVGNAVLHPAVQIADAAIGGDLAGLTTQATSVSAGPTAILTGPASGKRLVKSILLVSSSATATVQLQLAGLTLMNMAFTQAGFIQVDCLMALAVGEQITATVTNGPVSFTVSYADRTDGIIDRLGFATGSTTGTLIPAGADRVIRQVYLANTSRTTAGTVTLTVAGTVIVPAVPLAAGGFTTIDMPIALKSTEAFTFSGDGVTPITVMASGY